MKNLIRYIRILFRRVFGKNNEMTLHDYISTMEKRSRMYNPQIKNNDGTSGTSGMVGVVGTSGTSGMVGIVGTSGTSGCCG